MPRKGENIRKRKDGRWEGRISCQLPTGKRKVYSVYAGTYLDVRKKQRTARTELAREKKEKAADSRREAFDLPIHAVAEEWLAKASLTRKQSTCMKYRSVYRLYIAPFLADKKAGEISGSLIEDIMGKNRGMSASTQNSIRTVMKHIFSFAKEQYGMDFPAVKGGKTKKKQRQTEVFSFSEQTRLLSYLEENPDRKLLGIYICLFTGIRLGEVCSLKWENIDFQAKAICINSTVLRIAAEGHPTKTVLLETEPKSECSKRRVPIPGRLLKKMEIFRDDGVYVLGTDRPMEPRSYENVWRQCLERAGIHYRNFHCLRHTFATNCVESGIDAKSLSEILGHSDVRITLNRYVHPSMEVKRMQMDGMVAFLTEGL